MGNKPCQKLAVHVLVQHPFQYTRISVWEGNFDGPFVSHGQGIMTCQSDRELVTDFVKSWSNNAGVQVARVSRAPCRGCHVTSIALQSSIRGCQGRHAKPHLSSHSSHPSHLRILWGTIPYGFFGAGATLCPYTGPNVPF